ncbi:probable insulin-like peptide 5 [Drosophila takahashii]|uniref:probable insulin-like peptide 5 n=1 Tax=Drosophila takahashii TaxID=29030 RepID=UPI0038991FB2
MMFRSVMPLLLLLIPLLESAEAFSWHQACGPDLTELVLMMCPNGVAGMYQKRDSTIFDYVMADGGDADAVSESHNGRMNSLTGLRRDFRGIVDQCCRKPCAYNTLMSYCK